MNGPPHPLLRLVPLVFLVPIAAGFTLSVTDLLGTRHPVYGWTMSINADAEAMYLGIWPFQDPAAGYTGNAYTPLFPVLASLLNHLHFWTGWSPLLVQMSVIGAAAVVARLAYRPQGPRAIALLEAAGVAALGVSFLFGLLRPAVFEARSDHVAIAMILAAIALVPRAVRLRGSAALLVIALLTAAFWTKQTAVVGWAAVAVMLAAAVWGGQLRFRHAFAGLTCLVAVNAALLGVLTAATDGWQYRFNFGISLPRTRTTTEVLPEILERTAPALALVVLFGVLAWIAAGRPTPGRLRAGLAANQDRLLLVAGFAALALLGLAGGVYLRRYAGGDDNNLLPGVWGLAGLAALAYRELAVARATAAAAAIACLLVFATTFVPGDGNWRLRGGEVVPRGEWAELPAAVDELARRTLVWDPLLSDLNVRHQRVIFPNSMHVQEALLRDRRPRALERALLGRRFGVVYGPVSSPQNLADFDELGWEDNYYWKLNQVLAYKYRVAPRLPRLPAGEAYASPVATPARVPRQGADPAPWLDSCFGPFTLAGVEMTIRRGGGLWCVSTPGVLSLRATPARVTEVVSSDPVGSVRGRMTARIEPRAGAWRMEYDGGWSLRGSVPADVTGLRLELADGRGAVVARAQVPRVALRRTNGVVAVELDRGARVALTPTSDPTLFRLTTPGPSEPGKLHFWASQRSRAEFNLQDLAAE